MLGSNVSGLAVVAVMAPCPIVRRREAHTCWLSLQSSWDLCEITAEAGTAGTIFICKLIQLQ